MLINSRSKFVDRIVGNFTEWLLTSPNAVDRLQNVALTQKEKEYIIQKGAALAQRKGVKKTNGT